MIPGVISGLIVAALLVVQTARVEVPPALNRRIPEVRLTLGGDINTAFVTLAGQAGGPMGIELLPNPPVDPPKRRPTSTVVVGPSGVRDALNILLDRQPEYELAIADGVINVKPAALARKPEHFLDRPIARFDVKDVSMTQAVRVLRHLMNPAFSDRPLTGPSTTFFGFSAPGSQRRSLAAEMLFSKTVTLAIEDATPRQILNRLVAQHGELFWIAEYRSLTPYEAVEPIETNCTLLLSTFA